MHPLLIVLLIIIGIIALIALLLLSVQVFGMRMFQTRFEGDPHYKFMALSDFPGLKKVPVEIYNQEKIKLNGGIFLYPKRRYEGVIIFYHGLFSGHINYLQLINYFTERDYVVVAFDFMGNMSSGGKKVKGTGHSEIDAKAIIDFVLAHPALREYPIYTMGHSWGGHTALTSLLLSPHIKKAVAFNPFNSDVDCAYSMSPALKAVGPLLYLYNILSFGYNSTYKVTDALKQSEAKKLIITGEQDQIIKSKYAYQKFVAVNDKNTEIINLKDYNHFTYMGLEGAIHFTQEVAFPRKEPINFDHLDYAKINTLNEELLEKVIAFLKK